MIQHKYLDKYNLKKKVQNGYILAQVTKGMYVLPQAELIAHYALVKHMDPYGYNLLIITPVIFTHVSWTINLTLLVDDFGVKYPRKEHVLHPKAEVEKI